MGPPAAIYSSSSFSVPNDLARQASKPAPSKTSSYEVNDMLMGTGIDLDEETEILNNLEGPTNQPAGPTDAKSQEEYGALAADQQWNKAAHQLAVKKSQELSLQLLGPGILHKRLHEVAQKYGLGLNLETKADGRTSYMGKTNALSDILKPELKVVVKENPDGTRAQTLGSFIPKDSFLSEQIALLSIGTKERLRDLLSDANTIAMTRQESSHGIIPPEWADAAVPPSLKVSGISIHTDSLRTGGESAVSPRTNPLKRMLALS
jgi:hypothetical protein